MSYQMVLTMKDGTTVRKPVDKTTQGKLDKILSGEMGAASATWAATFELGFDGVVESIELVTEDGTLSWSVHFNPLFGQSLSLSGIESLTVSLTATITREGMSLTVN